MCLSPIAPGLGRAPATALAYMYWLRGWKLQEAYDKLTGARRCSPRVEAIRAATGDLLTDSTPVELTIGLRRRGTGKQFQVCGRLACDRGLVASDDRKHYASTFRVISVLLPVPL